MESVRRPSASTFQDFPLELLRHALDYLPAFSAASFSLSSLEIKILFGSQHIQNLAKSSDDTVAFLKLLERDLPNRISVHHAKVCIILTILKDILEDVLEEGARGRKLSQNAS
jgi:hypothetical protein